MDLFNEPFKLRPHQAEAVHAVEMSWQKGHTALLDMATGSGKTIIFAELMKRFHVHRKKKALAIAHTDELVTQAMNKIHIQSGFAPSREQAGDVGSRDTPFVVGSVKTMQNTRLEGWNKNHFGLLVVDEAHHSVAPTYQNIIKHFNTDYLVGVSATCDRFDLQSLGEIYNEVAYSYPLHTAIRDGNLVPIVGKKVQDFDIDLKGLKVVRGDYTEHDLGDLLKDYFSPIAHNVIAETKDMKTLLFMPNVESSRLMAEELKGKGIPAAYLAGTHKKDERRKILYDFHVGNTTHLCACNILLEGFDEPAVEAIVMLRPTPSRPLFAQAIGRGTRLSPDTGKEKLLLVEFTFNSDKLSLVSTFDLFATAGYEEKVRELAKAENPDDIDYLDALALAKKKYYSSEYLLDRLINKEYGFVQFDPLAAAEMLGKDITGEFDIHWEGRKLEGKSTFKQQELLARYGIANPDKLSKAQASVLISSFSEEGYIPSFGEITSKQAWKVRQLGGDPKGMMKAQASIYIQQLIKQRDEKDEKLNLSLEF